MLVHCVRHFDDPFAVVVVSEDSGVALTQETVLALTRSALLQAGLEPLSPVPAYGNDGDPERFIGRNRLRPNDRVGVTWNVRGSSYPTYTVRLEREASSVKASVYENWK